MKFLKNIFSQQEYRKPIEKVDIEYKKRYISADKKNICVLVCLILAVLSLTLVLCGAVGIPPCASYILSINIVFFFAMRWDKKQAEDISWRIPNKYFIIGAWLGGAFGARAGISAFEHKTTYKNFVFLFTALSFLYAILLGCCLWLWI